MNAADLFADIPDDLDAVVSSEPVKHPFEAAGLGIAPFYCVRCTDAGEFGADSCRFCGHDIRYQYHVRDSLGAEFIVGSDCVVRTNAKIERFDHFADTMKKLKSTAAKARKAAKTAQSVKQWKAGHETLWTWMAAHADAADNASRFAVAMVEALDHYGSLTDGQVRGIERWMEGEERAKLAKVEREHIRQVEALAAPAVDTTRLITAFGKAQASGLKFPKITMNGVTFSPAGSSSSNPGGLWIKAGRGYESTYLGKITSNGHFVKSRECSTDREAMIVELVNDPQKAVTAYGLRTGNCAICNRELTKGESVDRGIGPICAEKFGW